MKETNMEHYRGEIARIVRLGTVPALYKTGIDECKGEDFCQACKFSDDAGYMFGCGVRRLEWLMSEYKPEPVLTEREKHFVEFAGSGYLTRNENDRLLWWTGKPTKQMSHWAGKNPHITGYFVINDFDDMFPFITWEDEEPWAVEELRKLKVADE